jgi:hypothetical protein
MRTTHDIDDRLYGALRREAEGRGWTIPQFIEDLLRRVLREPTGTKKLFKLEWVVVEGHQPPDIGVSDRNALYDRMEGRE